MHRGRYDPDFAGEILARANIGYDAAAASLYSALQSGAQLSRYEAMVTTTETFGGKENTGLASDLDKCDDPRRAVINGVTMEKGIKPMDMMPLPTWIEGEGNLGNPNPVHPWSAHANNQSSSQNTDTLINPKHRSYGGHFKAPKP